MGIVRARDDSCNNAMGHTDVVGVQRENWTVDPFGAIVKDGYVYGRGTLDDKDNVTAALMLMLLLDRAEVELDRDVIFLAEAGEEGTTRFGIDYMVENHWDEIAAEYCLAEGGGTVSRDGDVRYVAIATTEKFPMRVRLVAHGTAGHGSVPRIDNAVTALARAVDRVAVWQTPLRLNETTRAYFDRLAETQFARAGRALQRHRRPGAAAAHRALFRRVRTAALFVAENLRCPDDDERCCCMKTLPAPRTRGGVGPVEQIHWERAQESLQVPDSLSARLR